MVHNWQGKNIMLNIFRLRTVIAKVFISTVPMIFIGFSIQSSSWGTETGEFLEKYNKNSIETTPLHMAITNGDEEKVKVYLNCNQTDPNTKDKNGHAPLSLAVYLFCKPDQNVNQVSDDLLTIIMIHFLEHDLVNPNIKDIDGNTPFTLFLKYKHFEFADLFLSYPKTDPNLFNGRGHTELTQALYFEDLDIVEFLLSYPQTDPNARNERGEVPLDLAIRCGERKRKIEKVKWFLSHPGTVVTTQVENHRTPLSTAIELRLTEIVKLLLPHDKEGASIALGNYEQLLKYQKRNFILLSDEEREKLKEQYQNILDSIFVSTFCETTSIKADFVIYHAVEDMMQVADILSKTPPKLDTHRVGFIDLDETLFFSGALGWVNECFNLHNQNMEERMKISQLLLKYGFLSVSAFADWGNSKFGVFAGTWDYECTLTRHYIDNQKSNFCTLSSIVDSNVSNIFKEWHAEGMNIFCLTARGFGKKLHNVTLDFLGLENIILLELTHISIEKPERSISSGIIYSWPKFGTNAGGIKFLEQYLEKLSFISQHFPNIEIIIVDNCQDILTQIISLSNRQEIQRLEEKFNTKINFRYFQPYEERWRSPHINWDQVKELGKNHNATEIAFRALQNFLETFCTPLEKIGS